MARFTRIPFGVFEARAALGAPLALLAFALGLGSAAAAGPSGEQVAAGLAEFSRQGGNLTVNQLSERAIINWQDFSIGQGSFARFVQPGSGSAVLNRVVSGNPSEIFGELSANGRVFLINRNGILVGQSGVIDTQGFVGSTLDLSNEAFMAGGDLEFSGGGLGAIRNLGQIRGLGGDVFLIAPQVDNQGLVQAGGTAGIAAGAQVLLRESGSQRLWVGAAPAAAGGNGIDNSGLVQAAQAELQAAGGNVYALSINNTGAVRATTVSNEGGRVLLRAGNGGTVVSSGVLDASSETGQGGRIEVSGTQVGLMGDALVDASGRSGGGEVLIGGDFQGKNAAVPNAQRTYVGAGASIRADALDSGDGGKVIVWADDITRYYGNISARGGSAAGDGGFVEVSGKEHLSFAGHVDAGAAQGRAGSLLLDPKNIVIANGGSNALTDADAFGDNPGDDVTIAPGTITAATNNNTAVILRANNDILINGNITSNNPVGNGGALLFQAGRSININANVTSDNGNITFSANDPNAIEAHRDAGAAVFQNDGQIHAGSGNVIITLGAGIGDADPSLRETGSLFTGNVNAANLTVAHEGYTAGGLVDIGATTLTGNLTVTSNDRDLVNTSGAITVLGVSSFNLGTGDFTVTGANTDFDSVRFTSANNVTVNDTNAIRIGQGAVSNIAGDLIVTSRGPIGTQGAVVVQGATTLTANTGGFGTNPASITLNNGGNNFVGPVTVTAASSVTLTDSNSLALTDLIAGGDVTLNTSGNITASGRVAMPIGSIFTINAGVSGDVTLTDTDNVFSRLMISSGRNLDLVSSTGVSLWSNSTVSGNLDLTAGGTIQNEPFQSGRLAVTGDTVFRVTAPNSDLLLGSLSNNNDFTGSVSMLTGGSGSYRDVAFRNINAGASIINGFPATLRNAAFVFDNAPAVVLPGMTLTGGNILNVDNSVTPGASALYVRAPVGSIAQTGPIVLTQAGARARFFAGTSKDITLTDAGNDFKTIYVDQGNNVSLRDANALTIERIINTSATGAGDLTVVTDGAVDLNDRIQIKGLASFDAGNTNNVTLNNITFNQVGTLQFVSANNASYQGASSLVMAESDVSGTLSLQSNNVFATLTQTGPVRSGSTTTFGNFGGGIAMTNADNVFGPIVISSFLTSNSISIRENDAITQSGAWILNDGTLNLTTSNNQAITADNAGNQFQFVNVTQVDGGGAAGAVSIRNGHPTHGIRQSAAWTTAGVTTLHAGGNEVTLSNVNNVIGDLVVSNADEVTIVENDDITQGGAWSLNNVPVALTARNGNDIVLDRAANLFGDLILSGHDVTVVENALMTQGGAWTSTGTASLATGSNDIVLENNANELAALEIVSAGNAVVHDANALVIAGADVAGNLTLRIGGHLTQTGAIEATDLRLFGTGGYATLNHADNDVVNLAATFTGGALSYTDADDFTIATIEGSTGISIGANAATLVSVGGTVNGLGNVNPGTTGLSVSAQTLAIPPMSITGPQSYTAPGGIALNGTLTSTAAGAILLDGPVTLGNHISVNSVNSDVTFTDTIDGDQYALTVSAGSGSRTFGGALSNLGTAVDGLALTLLGSGSALFESTVSANNGISSAGPVTFRDDITLAKGQNGSTFNGLVTLGKVGGMDFIAYDGLAFNGGLLMENGPALIDSNDSTITLGDDVGGPYALSLDSGTSSIVGLSNLQPDLGGLTLRAFTMILPSGLSIAGPQSFTLTDADGTIRLGGPLSSTAAGDITFHSPVLLTASSTVSSVDSAITFEGPVTGAFNLGVSSGTGVKTFGGAVGNILVPIGTGAGAAITLQGAGGTLFEGGVQTASGMVSEGPVTFTANVTLGNGDTGSSFGGVVTAGDLTISGYDGIAFDGGLSLVDGPLQVVSNGSTISFGDTVSGAQDLVLTALSDGAGTVTGLRHVATDLTALTVLAHTLSLPQEGVAVSGPMHFTAAGGITLNGDVGNGDTGEIDFIGPVTLATQAVAVTSGDADITFSSTVTGAQNLTVDAGAGAKTFDGAVDFGSGAGHALVLRGSGDNTFEGEVTLASGLLVEDGGDVTFRDDVILGNGDTGSDFGSGLLTIGRNGASTTFSGHDGLSFGGDIVLLGDAVTIDSNGADIVFDSAGGITIDSSAATTFAGDVVLAGGALAIELDGDALTFTGGIDGGQSLTIDGAGQVVIEGAVGSGQKLGSLAIEASGLSLGAVSTTGTQSYEAAGGITLAGNLDSEDADVAFVGPVTLADDITVSTGADAGNITFTGAASTIDGGHDLVLAAGTGNVVLGGRVGDTAPLTSLDVSGFDLTVPLVVTDPAGAETYTALNDLTLTQSRSVNGPIAFRADADSDGSGSFVLLDGVSVTAVDSELAVTAADIDLQGNSSLNSGTGRILIEATSDRDIAIGGAGGAGTLHISADELARMTTTGGFSFTAPAGDIDIDTVLDNGEAVLVLDAIDISQTAEILAGGLDLRSASGDIDLSHADNLYGPVAIGGTPNSVSLRNGADIVQNGAWLLEGVAVTLNAADNDILLTEEDNRFGTLSLTGDDAEVVSAIDLTLGAGALSGSLEAEADGAITVTGALDIEGDLTLTANGVIGQSAPITVGGDVSLTTLHAGGDVSLSNDGDTLLGDGLVGGDFSLDSKGGNVTQALGTTLKVAGAFDPTGSGNVILNNPGNIVVGYVPVAGDNVIQQLGVITLDGDDIGEVGNLTVISQASEVGFGGQVVAGDAIVLTDAGNSFGGKVSITTDAPEITSDGSPDVQTGIQQAPGTSLNVTGQAIFTAEDSSVPGSGFIHLTNAGNRFGSLVLSGTDVQVRQDAGAMVIDAANASEQLVLISNDGGIGQTGAIVTPALDVTAAGAVTLNHAANQVASFSGATTGDHVTLHTLSALDLAGIATGGGDLTLAAGGAISQSGALSGIGVLTLTADGAIGLLSGGNSIQALGDVTGSGDVGIGNSGDGLLIDGAIVTTEGDITVLTEGDLTIADGRTLTVNGAGDVVLLALGDFINNNDGETIILDDGRFLVYTTDVAGVRKGGLSGGALFSRNYADHGPGTISQEGNLFIYSFTPVLTFRPDSVSVIYGEAPVLTYGVTGLVEGHTAEMAYEGDPELSTDAVAGSNVGSYLIHIAQGGLTLSDLGYGAAFEDDGAAVTVDPRTIDLSGARTYDGTADLAAAIFTLGNLLGDETLTLSGTGTMADRHVGDGKAVTLGTLALGDGDNGGLAGNYTLIGGEHLVDITPAALTISSSDVVKVYDGTTSAAGTAIVTVGELFGDDGISGGSFAYTNPNAGNGNKVVTVSGVTVDDGNNGGNYTVVYANNTTSTIDPYVVDLSGSRVYDGTADLAAGIFSLSTLVGDETLTLSGVGSMADRHVGDGKAVTLGTLALGDGDNGGLAGNYTLIGGEHLVDITPAALAISTSDVVKVYDGTTSANGTAIVTAGELFGDDGISGGSFAYTNPNAGNGNKVVTVSGVTLDDGNGGGNYTVVYANNTTSTIDPYVVDLSGSRVYDGTADLAAGIFSLSALVGDETLTLSGMGTMADRHVGDGKAVTLGTLALGDGDNGGLAGNYTLAGGEHLADITPAALTISSSDVVKTYDGTSSANGTAIVVGGALFADDAISGGSFAYADPNAGDGNKVVMVSGVTVDDGNNGGNYTVVYADNTTSTIDPYVVDLSGSRVYDGTADLAAGIFSLSTLVGDETLTLSGIGSMADRHVGDGKAVTLGTLALGDGDNGGLAGNYTLIGGEHLVDITPAALTVSSSDVVKVYDGTTSAGGTAIVTVGELFGDDGISGGSFAYTNPNAGNGNKVVTVSGVTVDDGNGGGNYTVVYADNTTSTITPAALTVSSSDVVKVYDGTTSAAGTAIVTVGELFGDDEISGGSFAYTNPNAGNGNKVVTVSGVTVDDGNGGGNYTVVYADNTSSTITPYVVDLSGSRVYDGTADLAAGIFSLSALVGDETLTLSGMGTMADRHVGDGKAVTLGTLALGDGDNGGLAGNYTLIGGEHLADITPAALTIAVDDQTRLYGSSNPILSYVATGFVDGEDVSFLTGFEVTTAATESSNVGGYDIVASGSSSDYAIDFVDGTLTINPAPLTITIHDQARSYGAENPVLSYDAEGFVLGHDISAVSGFSIGTAAHAGSAVGSYAITGAGSTSGNYALVFEDGTLTVNPAVLSVSVANASRSYGRRDIVFLVTVSGFVNGETGAVAQGELQVEDTTALRAQPGVYEGALLPSGITAPNYTIDFVAGTLTINGVALPPGAEDERELAFGTLRFNERQGSVTPLYAGSSIVPVEGMTGGYFLAPGSGLLGTAANDEEPMSLMAYASSFSRP